jgi:glyoxylase-like metal-dependent hydrolase (beta-lactamase superfamily II)
MTRMNIFNLARVLAAVLALAFAASPSDAQVTAPKPAVTSLRLYVMDGGVLASDPSRYNLKNDEVQEQPISIGIYLIVHPRGVLLWDAGAVSDGERAAGGNGTVQTILRRDGQERFVTLTTPLLEQLASTGFSPADVTHLVLSHDHWDHTANANAFAHAQWLTPQIERDAMFSADPPGGTRPATYASLKNSRTTLIGNDYDVFGDGTVVIKQARGHTEGHQVLYLKLAKTGGVVLTGDLYHYPEERTLNRPPTIEYNVDQTKAARVDIDEFLKRTGAQLWIQHDLVGFRKLKKAPAFYE